MTSGAPPIRRRKVVVKRGFQFRYAGIMFVLFALAAFMVWWEVFHTFRSLTADGVITDPAAVRVVGNMSRTVLFKVAAALALVWFLALILSHFLAGPLYRFEACFRLLKGGDLSHRANLRPHDELKSLAVDYNGAVEALQARVKAIRDAAHGADSRTALEKIRAIIAEFKV
jgi:methyl-accepting chemotaxis protein